MNLIRCLLGLIITITMLPICTQAFINISNIDFNYYEINDEICLSQLREIFLIAYNIKISDKEISFLYKDNEYVLSEINNKLVLHPGTQIFISDIDDLYFFERNNCVYVSYERNGEKYERVIFKNERFYIDDFSTCDVLDDERCDGEE